MFRTLKPALAVALVVGTAASSPAQSSYSDTLSLAERVWVASKAYASVQLYFAHWEGAPNLDLDRVYRRYLEQATASPDRMEFDLATLEFFAQLQNGHSDFSDRWLWQNHGAPLGFSLRRLEEGWTVSESRLAVLTVGEVVERIDGIPTDSFLSERMRFIAASSDDARRLKLFWRPFLFPREFSLTLADGRAVTIRRGAQELSPVKPERMEERMLDGEVPYLHIPSFGRPSYEEAAVEFVQKHAQAPALIIDVRGNGGGTSPVQLIRALMDRPYRGFTESTALQIALFGAYRHVAASTPTDRFNDYVRGFLDAFKGFEDARLMIPGTVNQPGESAYPGELLLLADFGCASACEDFLLPFKQSGRGTILGRRTRGSTGQPYSYRFENGMSFRVSSKRVYFPNGSRFEGVGITPDIAVEVTPEDLERGRDVVLERALELARDTREES